MQNEVQEALQRASTALSNEQQARRDCQEQVSVDHVASHWEIRFDPREQLLECLNAVWGLLNLIEMQVIYFHSLFLFISLIFTIVELTLRSVEKCMWRLKANGAVTINKAILTNAENYKSVRVVIRLK